MSNPIGHTFMYNIIILFILIVFAFLAGTLSYYKAFKVNNRIINSIEKYEGYNGASIKEIETTLTSIGYTVDSKTKCKSTYRGMELVNTGDERHGYCVYLKETPAYNSYFNYAVVTYLTFDFPLIERFKIPVYTKTNQIYRFQH